MITRYRNILCKVSRPPLLCLTCAAILTRMHPSTVQLPWSASRDWARAGEENRAIRGRTLLRICISLQLNIFSCRSESTNINLVFISTDSHNSQIKCNKQMLISSFKLYFTHNCHVALINYISARTSLALQPTLHRIRRKYFF